MTKRTRYLAGGSPSSDGSSLILVAVVAVVMSCAATACVQGIDYMNRNDVLGYDSDETPGAYVIYMFMLIGAVCASCWGITALGIYAMERRRVRSRIVWADLAVLVALVVALVFLARIVLALLALMST